MELYVAFLRENYKSLSDDELLDVLSEVSLLYDVAMDKDLVQDLLFQLINTDVVRRDSEL